MFARPRPKKLLAPPPKKRKRQHAIDEIKFDDDARAEYLTGFHKRKLQRARNAQEQAAERARQEKIEARRQVCNRIAIGIGISRLLRRAAASCFMLSSCVLGD